MAEGIFAHEIIATIHCSQIREKGRQKKQPTASKKAQRSDALSFWTSNKNGR